MKLKCDVRSGGSGKKLYGLIGDEVKVISERGNVVIVEGVDGVRFPTLKENLTDGPVKVIPKPAAPADTVARLQPIINRVPASKKKAAPIKQSNLF